jgi:hypothetical protein
MERDPKRATADDDNDDDDDDEALISDAVQRLLKYHNDKEFMKRVNRAYKNALSGLNNTDENKNMPLTYEDYNTLLLEGDLGDYLELLPSEQTNFASGIMAIQSPRPAPAPEKAVAPRAKAKRQGAPAATSEDPVCPRIPDL